MTAEQALIEENKKDPRVRYITYSKSCKVFTFWAEKPIMTDVKGDFYDNSYISHIENVDLLYTESFILCIDDIKPEVPPIPEKWYIECTEENRDVLNGWRLENAKDYIDYEFHIGFILLSKNELDESLFYGNKFQYFQQDSIYKNYQEITIDQFKKYVLGEEKQDENSSSHSTGSYVKYGSIGSVEFSGKYVKTGRIGSNDMVDSFAYPFRYNPMANIDKSEIEQSHKEQEKFLEKQLSIKYYTEDRINYINHFIKRNIDSDLCINPAWITERNELIEKLKNL